MCIGINYFNKLWEIAVGKNCLDMLSASTSSTVLGYARGIYYSMMLSDVLWAMMAEWAPTAPLAKTLERNHKLFEYAIGFATWICCRHWLLRQSYEDLLSALTTWICCRHQLIRLCWDLLLGCTIRRCCQMCFWKWCLNELPQHCSRKLEKGKLFEYAIAFATWMCCRHWLLRQAISICCRH